MIDKVYTSEKDITNMITDIFGIKEFEWKREQFDYNYGGLATYAAKIHEIGISIIAFPLLIGYAQQEVPIYRARIISDRMSAINSSTYETKIAKYRENGMEMERANGEISLKKTIDTRTHHPDSVNTINLDDLKKAIFEILEAKCELILSATESRK